MRHDGRKNKLQKRLPSLRYNYAVRTAIKIGGVTMLFGALAGLLGMAGGFGPCGPASVLGTFLFFGGVLAFAVGATTVAIGVGTLAWQVLNKPTHN